MHKAKLKMFKDLLENSSLKMNQFPSDRYWDKLFECDKCIYLGAHLLY